MSVNDHNVILVPSCFIVAEMKHWEGNTDDEESAITGWGGGGGGGRTEEMSGN